jgi:uncharacterized glyoxalase superfamily protein PhnB
MPSEMWDAPDVVPSITYSDIPTAVEWLSRSFGFRERLDARLTWPGGGMAWIELGRALIGVSRPDPSWGEDADDGASAMFMKIYVDDVDAHFAHARAAGARIVSAPEDGFWGGRVYRALDHEGHRWEFSQRGRDLAAARWRLPPGVIRGAPAAAS